MIDNPYIGAFVGGFLLMLAAAPIIAWLEFYQSW